MDKEKELKRLKQKLHDEEVGAFYSECLSPNLSDVDKAHNQRLADDIDAIKKQIIELESNS